MTTKSRITKIVESTNPDTGNVEYLTSYEMVPSDGVVSTVNVAPGPTADAGDITDAVKDASGADEVV